MIVYYYILVLLYIYNNIVSLVLFGMLLVRLVYVVG